MSRMKELSDALETRRGFYQSTFESDTGTLVLGDLYHLCCAGRSTYAGDREAMLINEGKRQVWLHIISVLNITDMDLHRLGLQHTRENQP